MRPHLIRAATVALLCGVLAAALNAPVQVGLRAAEALPARLSDAEFWALVEQLSEPEGNFPFDNLVSNETSIQSVIPTLLNRTRARRRLPRRRA